MSFSSLPRFLSLSITPKTSKISTLHFTTSLADKLYTHLQNNPNNVEKSLNSIKPKLDTRCVTEVLHKCSLNNSQIGLRFFVWAGYQSNYRHSSFLYSKACKLFNIKQNPQAVLDLFEFYRAEKCVVNLKTFKVVLNLCKEGTLANEAFLVLRKMQEFDIHADTKAYTIVIRLFCDKGDMDMAQKLMGEMSFNDLYPDMVTYVSIIKGFCDIGRLEEACRLVKEMRAHGCVPNVVVYSTLVDGICRFGSVERALELLGGMEKEGGDCNPNVLTYTSVIQGLCEKGRTMDAFAVLDRMEACGCAPNRVTVSTLLKRLCMDGHLEEAYKLIDRVVAGGSVSSCDCYSPIVVCLIRIKKVEEAEKLFRRAVVSGVKPDGLACSLMIKELCFVNRVLDGYCLHDEIEKIGSLSTIDSDTYSVLLVGLCQQGYSLEAAKLARSLIEKRIHLKHPYVDKVVEYMKKFGVTDLVTELASIGR
ncbi:pentatricopeptide repeat-containing protein At5g47360 [Ricinus communis]|uniref:pentatricopeptide repeat-containing protein At5g47360 n=1 Tax=Ricinus communis TaxID=3988 RepID=UPI00201B27A3|nr:pentatricopeptide repeat-containing protein At5g47360 [Ricinus communis]XP_048230794.1 pentatricopeptide repeat-containing protein At5g47360 [Ricinus communis]